MNLIINTVGGQLLTLTPEMLQEKLGLKSDILSLGIEVSDVIQNRDGEFSSRCSTSKELFDFNVEVAQNR